MKLYPIFANIENRLAVIIGGGEVSHRKVTDLLDSGARIRIIAPEIHEDIKKLKKLNPDSIEIIEREYTQSDLNGAFIVFAATSNPEANKSVYLDAEIKHIFMNSADDPANCSFFVPSMTRKGDLILAVSTSGDSPAMAARLRKMLEKSIPENIEEVLNALREARKILKDMTNLSQPERAAILKKIIEDDELLEKLVQYNSKGSIQSFFNCILKTNH